MSQPKHSAEYLTLESDIVDLTFERVYPTRKLSQHEWEEIQKRIDEKKEQMKALLAKENA